MDLAQIHLRYWTTPEYYLDGLTSCEFRAKTDADGKYTLSLPNTRKYALAAQTQRKIPGSSETYWWLLWENPQRGNQTIVFNNDNLMFENPENKVMEIR